MSQKNSHEEFLSHFMPVQADLRAYISALVLDRLAVDDIMQETAIVLWSKFGDYDTSRPFAPWARTFARFQIKAYLKKHKRSRLVLGTQAMLRLDTAMAKLEEDIPLAEEREALHHCMKKLPERPRELLRLRYEEQLSFAAVCKQMKMGLAAVKKSLLRIRISLRDCCTKTLERKV